MIQAIQSEKHDLPECVVIWTKVIFFFVNLWQHLLSQSFANEMPKTYYDSSFKRLKLCTYVCYILSPNCRCVLGLEGLPQGRSPLGHSLDHWHLSNFFSFQPILLTLALMLPTQNPYSSIWLTGLPIFSDIYPQIRMWLSPSNHY